MNWLRTYGVSLVFALLLSFALWAYVSYSQNPDRSTSFEGMSVQVQGLSPGLVIVDQEGLPRQDQTTLSSVNITIKADQDTLSRLSQSHISAFVDLTSLDSGDHQLPVNVELTRSDLRLSNFSAIDSEPELVQVRLERLITNTIPLSIEVQGNLPASFEQGKPESSFNGKTIQEVIVKGPQNRVERVVSAQAIANVEQLSTSYVAFRDLQALDANKDPVEGVVIQPPTIKVRVPIRSVVGLKRVPVIGTLDGFPAPGYVVANIQCIPPLITISGSSRRLDEIDQIQTIPIAIEGATDVITKQVGLILPLGVSSQLNEEAIVQVVVNITPLDHRFLAKLPFTVDITGQDRNLDMTYEPRIIKIPVAGSTASLQSVDQSTLIAALDVSGFALGTYTMTPRVTLPEGLEVAGDIPLVTVSLSAPPEKTPTPTATTVQTQTDLFLPTISTLTPSSESFPVEEETDGQPTNGIEVSPDTVLPIEPVETLNVTDSQTLEVQPETSSPLETTVPVDTIVTVQTPYVESEVPSFLSSTPSPPKIVPAPVRSPNTEESTPSPQDSP